MENQETVVVRRCWKNINTKERRRVPLSELPCKPGESFFAILSNEVCELVFKHLSENAYNNDSILIICTIKGKDWDLRCVDYKKNAFKTFEEAQTALSNKLVLEKKELELKESTQKVVSETQDILSQLRYSSQIKKVETSSGIQEVVTVRRCFKNLKLTDKITVPLSELPCRPGEAFFAIISNEVCELVFKYLSENAYNNSTINIICTIKGKDWDLRCVDYKENAFKTFEEAQIALSKKLAS